VSTGSADPGGTGPVTLRFAVYGDAQTVATYERLADAWTDQHPDVKVVVSHQPDAAHAAEHLQQQYDAGDPPDVFLVDHEQLPTLVAQGRVQPVDELLEQRGVLFGDTFARIGLEGFSADSALQCMPHDVSPLVTFYNTRLLDPRTLATQDTPAPSAEDGWTWDQLTTAAQRIAHGGVKGVYVDPTLATLLPLVRSAGADLVDDDRLPTTLTTSDEGSRQALARILALARNPAVAPSRAQLRRHSALEMFEDGRLGMMFGTRRLVPKLRETPGLHFDVLPLPSLGKPRTVASMDGYCIAARSAHVPQAADFLAFASGPQGSRITTDFGGVVPANLSALHSDAFAEPGSDPRHDAVFAESLRHAEALPFVPGWPQLEKDTDPLLAKLVHGRKASLVPLTEAIDARSRQVLTAASVPPSPSS
jgi:multiple sugar transport system substrate-binding protein